MAACQLIDAYLDIETQELPRRLHTIRFPAALDWLRTEDVIRVAQATEQSGVSRKAFFNRWPHKESFLRESVVFALLYRDVSTDDPTRHVPGPAATGESLSGIVIQVADGFMR